MYVVLVLTTGDDERNKADDRQELYERSVLLENSSTVVAGKGKRGWFQLKGVQLQRP